MEVDPAQGKPFDGARGQPLLEVRHLVKQFGRKQSLLHASSLVTAVVSLLLLTILRLSQVMFVLHSSTVLKLAKF